MRVIHTNVVKVDNKTWDLKLRNMGADTIAVTEIWRQQGQRGNESMARRYLFFRLGRGLTNTRLDAV